MRCVALFFVTCLIAAGIVSQLSAEPDKALDISTIMVRAHLTPQNRGTRNNLDNKVLDDKATAAEKQELLELYRALAKAKPPAGRIEDWEQRTSELVKSLQAVYASEANAKDRFSKARDCKACHTAHREP